MIKITLHNAQGHQLAEVTVKETSNPIDGVQWGGTIFILHNESNQYRAASIVPAIIEKKKR